jgi:hypothetical protein
VQAQPQPWIVSEGGIERAAAFDAVEFDASDLGEYWSMEHATSRSRGMAIALSGEPSKDATLHRPPAPEHAFIDSREVVTLLAALAFDDAHRAFALADAKYPKVQRQAVTGRFPNGATRLVAVTIAFGQEAEYGGGLYTADDAGRLVQLVDSGEPVALDFLIDLDGDGFEEIVFTSQGWEDVSRWLVHLGPSDVERIELHSSGH